MALTLDNVKELMKLLFPNIKMLNKISESDGKPLYDGEPFSTELDLLETEHNDTAFIGGKLYTPTIHDTATVTDEKIKYWATGKGEEGIELDLLKTLSSNHSNISYNGTKTLGGYTYPYIAVTPYSNYTKPISNGDTIYFNHINEAKFLLPRTFDDYEAVFYMTEVNNALSAMTNYSILGNAIILGWIDEACACLILSIWKDRGGQCLLRLTIEKRFKKYSTTSSTATSFMMSISSSTEDYKNMGLKGVRAIVKKSGNSINVKVETRPNGGVFAPLGEYTLDLYSAFSYDSALAEKYKDKLIPVQIGVAPIGTTTSYIGIQDFNAYPSVEVETHNLNVKVSSAGDNSLTLKDDGLYVPPVGDDVAISQETGNQIVEKSDGLFVPAPEIPDAVTISQEEGNQIAKKKDGLYVPPSKVALSDASDNMIVAKPDGIYTPSYKDSQTIIQGLTEGVSLENVMNSFMNGTTNTTLIPSSAGDWDASSFTYPEYSFKIIGINSSYNKGEVISNLLFGTEYELTFDFILSSIICDNKIILIKINGYTIGVRIQQSNTNKAMSIFINKITEQASHEGSLDVRPISLVDSRPYRMFITRKGNDIAVRIDEYISSGNLADHYLITEELGASSIGFSVNSTMSIGLVKVVDPSIIVYDNKMHVKVSAQAENQLQIVDDGLYVPATGNDISISQEEGNQIIEKTDGIYVPSTEVALSAFTDNRILKVDDGLYVQGFTDSPSIEFNGEPGYGIDPQVLIDDFKKYNDNNNFKESFYEESETFKGFGVKGFKVNPKSTSSTYKDPYQIYSVLELGPKYEIEVLYPKNVSPHFTFAWVPTDTYFGFNYSIYIPGQLIYFKYNNYLVRPTSATDLYWVSLSNPIHSLYSKAAYRTLNVKRDGYLYTFTLTYYDANLKKLGSEGVVFDISTHTASDKNKVFASPDVKVRVAMQCMRDTDFGITKFYAPNLGDISAGNYAHVNISPDPDNALSIKENGLYAPQMNLLCSGEGIEGHLSDTSLTIDTKIDPSGNNALMTRGYGLYVPKIQESPTVSSMVETVEGTQHVDIDTAEIITDFHNNGGRIGSASYSNTTGYPNVIQIDPLRKSKISSIGNAYLTETFRYTIIKYKNYKAYFSIGNSPAFIDRSNLLRNEVCNILIGVTGYYRVCLSIADIETVGRKIQIVVTDHIKNNNVFSESKAEVIYENDITGYIDRDYISVEKTNSSYKIRYIDNDVFHEGIAYFKDSSIIMGTDKGLEDVAIGYGFHCVNTSGGYSSEYFRITSFAVEQGNGEELVHNLDVKVSSDEGNALEIHENGLYVPPAEIPDIPDTAISAGINNLIVQKSDGLYVAGFIESQTVTFKTNTTEPLIITDFLNRIKKGITQAPSMTKDNLTTSDYLQGLGIEGFGITRTITNENWTFTSQDKLSSKSKIHFYCTDGMAVHFALYDNESLHITYLLSLFKVPGYSHAWFSCNEYKEDGSIALLKNVRTVDFGMVDNDSMEIVMERQGANFNFTTTLHSGETNAVRNFSFNPMTECPEFMIGITGKEDVRFGFAVQQTTNSFFGIKELQGVTDLELTEAEVKVSTESGNVLIVKEDGLYVPEMSTTEGSASVSAKENNLITQESDGLYAPGFVNSQTVLIETQTTGSFNITDFLTGMKSNVIQAPSMTAANLTTSDYLQGIGVEGFRITRTITNENWAFISQDKFNAKSKIHIYCAHGAIIYFGFFDNEHTQKTYNLSLLKLPGYNYAWLACQECKNGTITLIRNIRTVGLGVVDPTGMEFIIERQGGVFNFTAVLHSGSTSITTRFSFDAMTECPEVMTGMTGQEPMAVAFGARQTTDMYFGIKELDGVISSRSLNAQVRLSAESNNAIKVKNDGLYVQTAEIPDVAISAKANNLITKETDGFYAPKYEDSPTIDFKDKSAEIKLSTELNNALQVKGDGLYVPVVKSNVTTASPFQNTTMVSYWEETNPTPDTLLSDLYKHPGYMYGNSDDPPDVTMMPKGSVFAECPCLKIGNGSNVHSGYLFGDYEIHFRIKMDKDGKEPKYFDFNFIYVPKKIELKLHLCFNIGSDKRFIVFINPSIVDEQGTISGGLDGIRVDNSNNFAGLDLSVTPLDIVLSKKKGTYTAQIFQQGAEKFKITTDIDEILKVNKRFESFGTLCEKPYPIRVQCQSSSGHYTYVGITSFECEGSRLNLNLSAQDNNGIIHLSDGLYAPFLGKFPIDTDTAMTETYDGVLKTEVRVSPKKNNFLLKDRSSGLFVPAINDNKVIKTSLTESITKVPIDIPAFVTDLVNNGIKSNDSFAVSLGNNPNSFVCGSPSGWNIKTAIPSFGNYKIQIRLECPEENFWLLYFLPFITDDYEISVRVIKNGQFLIDYREYTVYTYKQTKNIHNSQDSNLFKDGLFTDLVVERIGAHLHIEIKRDDTILKEIDLSVASTPIFSKTDKGLGEQSLGFGIQTSNSYVGGGFQIKELSEITDDIVNYDVDIKTSAQKDNQIQVLDDGLYVPKLDIAVPISEQPNNQIQKKDDGLFVEPTVIKTSAQEGNALSIVDDGLYAPDFKPKLDEHDYLIKTNKVINEGLDWVIFAINDGEDVKAFKWTYNYNMLQKFSVLDTSGTENALNMFVDNKIKVKAGKTYELSASICMKASSTSYTLYWIWKYVDENGARQDLGTPGRNRQNLYSNEYTDIAHAFYKCEHDTELTLEVFWDGPKEANMQHIMMMADIFVKEVRSVTVDPVNYVNKESGIEDTPVGHILTYMGLKAPKHYLICDGREVGISDYPYLAKQFLDEFGAMDYFGGDGTTTFCLPDLRNQFLRGYHGDSPEALSTGVGIKQEPTELPYIYAWADGTQGTVCSTLTSDNRMNVVSKADTINYRASDLGISPNSIPLRAIGTPSSYTTRPANVAVLYCIKYEPTYFMDFSTKTQGVARVYNQETVLWQNGSRADVPDGTIWTLSESYKTFDNIYVEIVSKDEAECNLVAPMTIPVSSMKDNISLTFFNPYNYQDNNAGYTVGTRCHLRFVNDITVVMESNTNKAVDDEMTLIPWKIVGIKLIAEQP